MLNTIKILEGRSQVKGSLRAIVKVQLASGMILHEVLLLEPNGRVWASPGSKPRVIQGQHVTGKGGKPAWDQLVSFASKSLRDAFSDAIVDAVRAQNPALLA